MSTCVLYIDESGDIRGHHVPLKNAETPLFTLTGLALPLEEWRNFDREYLTLKRQFFAPEFSKSSKRDEIHEIKGNTLSAPRNKDSRRRHAFLIKVFRLTDRYGGRLFCVTTIKNPKNPTPPVTIYTISLQYMIERFNIFIAEHASYDTGVLIADRTVKFDWSVAHSYKTFIFGTETGRQLTKIYEAPLFADSRLTAGLQIADNLSSAIFTNHYRYYCRDIPGANDYDHMRKYWDQLNLMQFKSRREYDGYLHYGFKTLRHDK